MSSIFYYGVDRSVKPMDEHEWTREDDSYIVKFLVIAASIEEATTIIVTATEKLFRTIRCFLVRNRIANSKMVLMRHLFNGQIETYGVNPSRERPYWPYWFLGRRYRIIASLDDPQWPEVRAKNMIIEAFRSFFDARDAPDPIYDLIEGGLRGDKIMEEWNGGRNEGTPNESEHMYLGTTHQDYMRGNIGHKYREHRYHRGCNLPTMDIHARISYGQITKEEGERILHGEKYPRAELNAPIPKSDRYTVTMTTRYS